MASIEYAVRATDLASTVFAKIALSADGLDKQLEDLGKRVAEPEVDLKDAAFTQGMIRCAERIDKLSAKMAEPGVDLSDKKFQAEIFKINAQLDRLDKRHVTATVDVNVDRSAWSRIRGMFGGGGGIGGLLGGAGGAAGAGAQTGGGVLSALGPYAQGGAIGLAAILAASLGPALLPAGLGLGVGGGGVLGAFMAGSSANKQLQKLQTALGTAKGAAKQPIQQQIAQLQKQSGGVLGFYNAAQGVFGSAKGTFLDALSAPGRGFSGGSGGQTGGPSFLGGMLVIFKQLGGFIKSIGPALGDMFRASLPFVGMFVKFLEQATKALLPTFSQLLKEMTPFLPVIGQGLMVIVKGFVGFLNAIGPSGMKASARIFVVLAEGMAAVMVALGHTINWLAENVPTWMRKITNEFRVLRHETAVIFDGIRHEIAHAWDLIFENSVGMVIRLGHNVETQFNSIRHGIAVAFDAIRHTVASLFHDIANAFDQFRHFQGQAHAFWLDIKWVWDHIHDYTVAIWDHIQHYVYSALGALRHGIADGFDAIRHAIAAAWDAIWRNTITSVRDGASNVVDFYRQLPGRILDVLRHLPGQLWNLAKTAIENIKKGAESVVPHLTSFFSGFAHGIVSIFKKIWGWFSPSAVMYQGGKSLMTGLEAGIKDHAHLAVRAASAAAHKVSAAGSGVQRWAGLVAQALRMEGLSPGLAGNVLFQMNTESGGNPNAINLNDINARMGDPSRGLMQTIGSTFQAYHWPGTSWNIYDPLANIAAALNYARHVYGPSLMSNGMGIGSGHGYDTGGWLPTGVSLAVNRTGRPERVLGPGEGGSIVVNVHVSPLASPADTGRKVAEVLAEFKKRGGWVYKPGGF